MTEINDGRKNQQTVAGLHTRSWQMSLFTDSMTRFTQRVAKKNWWITEPTKALSIGDLKNKERVGGVSHPTPPVALPLFVMSLHRQIVCEVGFAKIWPKALRYFK